MIILFWGNLGIVCVCWGGGGGGGLYPTNTLDRTLTLHFVFFPYNGSTANCPNCGSKIENVVLYLWEFQFPFVQNIVRIKQ